MALDTISVARLEITKIYIAAFNRAPDAAGLSNWLNQYEAGLMTYAQISEGFSGQPEYTTKYPSAMTNSEYITKIYTNVFGRSPDADGLTNWVNQLDASATTGFTRANIMNSMIAAASATGNTDGMRLTNQATFAVQAVVVDGVPDTTATAQFANITSDSATVTTATAAITASGTTGTGSTADAAAAVVNDATALKLTTAADLISVTATAGDDTINGLVGTITATGALADTFQSVDIIDGKGGNDTLNISLSTQAAAPGATVTNVENVNYTEYNAVGLNMANFTGVTNLSVVNSIGAAVVTNASEIAALEVKNTNVNATVGYTGTALLAGTADTQTVTLSNVGNGATVTLNSNTAANDFETITVNSITSANNAVLTGTSTNATTTLKITGDQALTLATTGMAALTTVDGSAATGNLTLNITPATATNIAITGGTGNDTIIMATLNNLDSINLGEGTDTVSTSLVTASPTAVTLTGVEILSLSGDDDGVADTTAINLDTATSLTTLSITGKDTTTAASADTLVITKAAASLTTLNFNVLSGNTAAAETVSGLTYSLKTASGTTDAVTINVDNTTATGVAAKKVAGAAVTIDALTLNGVEVVTLNVSANLSASTVATAATVADGGVAITGSIVDTSLRSLTLNSESFVNVGTLLSTAVHTIDGTAANGGVAVNVAAATNSATTGSTAVTITTGSGVDTITAATAGTNTITTGAGADTVTMGISTQSNVIDLGAGNDIFQAAGATASKFDTVTTGTGVDTVRFDSADALTAATPHQAKVVVTDFTAGSGGDKLDLDTNVALLGGAAGALVNFESETAGVNATVAGSGLIVITDNIDMSAVTNQATLNAALTAVLTTTTAQTFTDFNNLLSEVYIAIDDGADTYIMQLSSNGTDTAFDATTGQDNGTVLVQLSGVSNASLLTTDNFVDFL